ncbi:1,4-alpha-glucan branching protein [Streptomyces albus]|uniref:maltokinase N-terminal cap-like domain-containing protein n=1 Tax=Streptomyces albus TaxID=1888 RepID=UPI0036F55276
MAVIHQTVLKPTKLELLTAWLPSRPWYRGGADGPEPVNAGGFRLDDPEGEVGMEFIVVNDASGAEPATYLVPLTYRGAPLEGAEHALVGTMEHGVLGRRWVYDGCHDPVLVAQLLALFEGRATAQDQNVSDAPDRDITVSGTGAVPTAADFAAGVDDETGTELATAQGTVLRLHRVLRPAQDGPQVPEQGAAGQVSGAWQSPDGSRARGVFAVLEAGQR